MAEPAMNQLVNMVQVNAKEQKGVDQAKSACAKTTGRARLAARSGDGFRKA